jgi:hypothetical protein
MTVRTSAGVAVLALLGFAAYNPASAQPIAPNRPPSNAFGGFFFPGTTVVPNAGLSVNGLPRLGQNGAFGPNNALGPGFGNQAYYGPWAPYILSMQPVVFNNRGHWYSNYYGHWYPNGLTSGVGVLSNGGTAGGSRLGANPLIGAGAFGVPGAAVPGVGLPGAAVPGAGILQGMPGGVMLPGAVPALGVPGINR